MSASSPSKGTERFSQDTTSPSFLPLVLSVLPSTFHKPQRRGWLVTGIMCYVHRGSQNEASPPCFPLTACALWEADRCRPSRYEPHDHTSEWSQRRSPVQLSDYAG